jgi:Cupin domain
MFEMLRIASEKGFLDTNWDDLEFIDSPLGRAALIDIGDGDNETRPLVAAVHYPPGAEVPPHYHGTDYCSFIIDGEIEVTRRIHRAGDVRVVKKGTVYGPLKAGPDGCKVIEVFADRTGIQATFLNIGDDEKADLDAIQADVNEIVS